MFCSFQAKLAPISLQRMSQNPHQHSRQTLATTPAAAAPLRIILVSLPLWGASLVLTLFMPFTGIITFTLMAICLLWLPFTAKRGACPHCQHLKTFPFSGFGSACKSCGHELVLRQKNIHLLEPRTSPRHGSGRSST